MFELLGNLIVMQAISSSSSPRLLAGPALRARAGCGLGLVDQPEAVPSTSSPEPPVPLEPVRLQAQADLLEAENPDLFVVPDLLVLHHRRD